MAAHRYWRINIANVNNGSAAQIPELELRSAISGADQTGSGTASASSVQTTGREADKAFDNSAGTTWTANTTASWLAYDFGAGNSKDIVEIAISTGAWNVDTLPLEFALEYSDDGSTWTNSFSISKAGWSASTTYTFSAPGAGPAYRNWRLYSATLNGANVMSCAEMELRIATGGADQTGSGTATSDSNTVSHTASSAFDNSASTYWESNTALPHWIAYDFGSGNAKNVTQIAFTARNDVNGPSQSPNAFDVQYGDNGVTWKTKWSVNAQSGWTAGETRTFTASAAAAARPLVFVST